MVRAPLTDRSGFGDALTGRVTSGGGFAIRGLMALTPATPASGAREPARNSPTSGLKRLGRSIIGTCPVSSKITLRELDPISSW